MFIDVKKAHLNGKVKEGEHVYIHLPQEAGAKGKCGRLRRWLYGMRPAAHGWEEDYSNKLASLGFKKGKAAPTVLYCKELQVRAVVHGDDFTFVGFKKDLKEVERRMKE